MRFGTLSSRFQAVGQNLKRFWPAPVFLGLFLLLFVANDYLPTTDYLWKYNDMIQFLPFYGILCAILLFSDLFTARYATAVHALPVTRKTLFLNHCLSGLVMFLIPFAAALLMALVKVNFALEPVALWSIQMVVLWFYGFAIGVLACTLSGTAFGAIVTCLTLTFGILLVESAISDISYHLLVGICRGSNFTTFLSPMVYVLEHSGDDTSWFYYGAVAVASTLLLLLAVLLYRKRELEYAGNFAAFPWLKPWVKGITAILGGLYLGVILMYIMGWDDTQGKLPQVLRWLLPGILLGRVVAEMIVEKTVRVVSKKHLPRYLLCLVAAASLATLVWLDIPGVQTRVPEPEDVVSVEVSNDLGNSFTLEGLEDIADATELHKKLTDNLATCDYALSGYAVSFTYKMKNGSTLTRQYFLNLSVMDEAFFDLFSDIYSFFDDPDRNFASLMGVDCTPEEGYAYLEKVIVRDLQVDATYTLLPQDTSGLLEAIMEDLRTGAASNPTLNRRIDYTETRTTLYQIEIKTNPKEDRHHIQWVEITDPNGAVTQWLEANLPQPEDENLAAAP